MQSDMSGKPVFNTLAGNRQKQRRFDRDVTPDIDWLLQQEDVHWEPGQTATKLDYLYRSCTGALHEQKAICSGSLMRLNRPEAYFAYQLLVINRGTDDMR